MRNKPAFWKFHFTSEERFRRSKTFTLQQAFPVYDNLLKTTDKTASLYMTWHMSSCSATGTLVIYFTIVLRASSKDTRPMRFLLVCFITEFKVLSLSPECCINPIYTPAIIIETKISAPNDIGASCQVELLLLRKSTREIC